MYNTDYIPCTSNNNNNKNNKLKQNKYIKSGLKNIFEARMFWQVGWIYGISTFVGYLTPNLFLSK